MKIAVLGINYLPELTGIAVYNTEMCEYLVKKGHSVHVFTGFPYYPFGSDFSSWRAQPGHKGIFSTEIINGVVLKRCNLFKPKKATTIKRIIHEATFVITMAIRTLFDREKYDLVICVSPPYLLGLVAYIISKLKKIPFIFHIQDLQPDAAIDLGMITNKLFIKLLLAIERFIYKHALLISTISYGMKSRILSKGIEEGKVKVFYNWANPDTLKSVDIDSSFAKLHNLAGKFVVLHAGNMGEKQDMLVILEAAKKVSHDSSIIFLLVGRGSKRSLVEDYVKKNKLGNVILLNTQSLSHVNAMYSSASAALITQMSNVKDIIMPSKLFGPASVGKPIIVAASEDCDLARLTVSKKIGILVPPSDPDALVSAIVILKNNAQIARELGENGRIFITKERHIKQVLDAFEKDIVQYSQSINAAT